MMNIRMICGLICVMMLTGCGKRATVDMADYQKDIADHEARIRKLEQTNIALREEIQEMRARLSMQLHAEIREVLDGMIDTAVRERVAAVDTRQERGRGMRFPPETVEGETEAEAVARREEWEARRQEMMRRGEERMVDGILGDLNLDAEQREAMIRVNRATMQAVRDRFEEMRQTGDIHDRDIVEAMMMEIQEMHIEAASKVLNAEQAERYSERHDRIMHLMTLTSRNLRDIEERRN